MRTRPVKKIIFHVEITSVESEFACKKKKKKRGRKKERKKEERERDEERKNRVKE